MQVKVFESTDMASGLKKVKDELGPDALILSTRTIKNGKLGLLGRPILEITAAIDRSAPLKNGSDKSRPVISPAFTLDPSAGFNHIVDDSLDHLLHQSGSASESTSDHSSCFDSISAGTSSDLTIRNEVNELKNLVKGLAGDISLLQSGLDWLEEQGVEIIRLAPDADGLVTREILAAGFDADKTALVSIMWANNETGLINPVKNLAEFCQEQGVLFHTDAVQAVGKIPVDLQKVPADYLTFSAHKFHGPKGIGGLYVRAGRQLTPLLHGGEQMGGHRAGTVNVAFMVGMGLAMELAVEALDYESSRVRELRDRLEDAILAIPDTVVLGKREHRTPNTILASFRGIEGEAFLWDLDRHGIAASTGSACSSESLEADATLRAMVSDADLAHTAVRFSLSRFTTTEEIDDAVKSVAATVERLRNISSTY